MIRQYNFDLRTGATRDQTIDIPGGAGALLVVDGVVPRDLTIEPITTVGSRPDELFVMRRATVMRSRFAQLRVRHGTPESNGIYGLPGAGIKVGSFTLYVCDPGDEWTPGLGDARVFLTAGNDPATRHLPARIWTTQYVAAANLSIGPGPFALYTAGQAVRILGYSLTVPGTYTLAALGHVRINLSTTGGFVMGSHCFTAPAAGQPGTLLDTGFVPLGNGIVLAAAESAQLIATATSLTVAEALVNLSITTE